MTANGYLEFVGFARNSLYQEGETYVLKLGQGVPIPQDTRLPDDNMASPDYYWQETTLAPDTAYSFAAPIEDPWYARRLLATNGPHSETVMLPISRPFSAGPAATVSLRLWGGTDYPQFPDHHVQVAINAQPLADVLFDGISEYEISQSVATQQLPEGDLSLTVTLPKDLPTAADLVHLESWSVRYPRQPILMNGSLQLETSLPAIELRGAQHTEYAIYRLGDDGSLQRIRHYQLLGDCAGQAAESCSLRFVANGTGQAHSARYFIQSADSVSSPVLELPPLPEDIVSAKADYLIIAHPDFIGPALQPLVDHHLQQGTVKVVDVRQVYAWFSHYNVDAQAIADYIAFAVANMGTRQVLLVGGDSYDYQNKLGLGAISFVPTLYAQTDDLDHKAFVDDDGVAQARAKITQAIENGVALTSFVGHSGPRDWTYSGLFKAADAQALNNTGKPTLVTQWGCWNTYFVSPEEDTMAHAFMLNASGGAAAVLGASTLTRADAERGLAKLVLENLTVRGLSLGQAVLQRADHNRPGPVPGLFFASGSRSAITRARRTPFWF